MYHQSVKQFGSRSGPTFYRAWSGSKLFEKFHFNIGNELIVFLLVCVFLIGLSCAFLWEPLIGMVTYCTISLSYSLEFCFVKEALAIRRIFSLVDMITKAKFSNSPNHSVGPEVYGICACTFFWDCTSTDKLFVQGGRLETVSRFVVFVSFDYFSVK